MDVQLPAGKANDIMAKRAAKKEKVEMTVVKETGVTTIEDSFIEDDFVPDTQPVVVATEDEFNVPSDEVRKTILTLKDEMKDSYVKMCQYLHHVQRKTLYSSWGFGTFDEYVASELEFEKSKARYLIQVWECLYEQQGDKTVFTKVMTLGWVKATILIHVINSENVDEWVEKGKIMTCDQLKKEVKKLLDQKIPDDPKEAQDKASEVEGTPMENATKTLTLQLRHDDYLAVCQAVELMQSMENGLSVSQSIAMIAREFMSSAPQEDLNNQKGTVVEFLKRYESLSSLKLVIIDPENNTILHGAEHMNSSDTEMSQAHEEAKEVADEPKADMDPIEFVEEDFT